MSDNAKGKQVQSNASEFGIKSLRYFGERYTEPPTMHFELRTLLLLLQFYHGQMMVRRIWSCCVRPSVLSFSPSDEEEEVFFSWPAV